MSERGVFAVDRGIFDHPLLAGEPYTKVQAFMWLVAEAAWKPHRRAIGSTVVILARGQVAVSVRFLASKWQWTAPRVQRFLACLKTDTMIETASDTGITVVTICNYDAYQRVSLPRDTARDTPSDTVAIQSRYKGEDKENKETSLREVDREKARKHVWPDDFREVAWARYGKPVEKKAAIAALENLHRADKTDWTEFIGGVDRQAVSVPDPKFRPSLERFIKREKWTDQQLPMETPNGSVPSARIARFAPRSGSSGTVRDAVAAGMVDRAGRRGFGPGSWTDHRGPEDARDHRSRRDDPSIEDADWTSAASYQPAYRRA